MDGKRPEACGRCSITTVTDATEDGRRRDPYGEDRIEVSEDRLRLASPHSVALGWLERRLDGIVMWLTYGR